MLLTSKRTSPLKERRWFRKCGRGEGANMFGAWGSPYNIDDADATLFVGWCPDIRPCMGERGLYTVLGGGVPTFVRSATSNSVIGKTPALLTLPSMTEGAEARYSSSSSRSMRTSSRDSVSRFCSSAISRFRVSLSATRDSSTCVVSGSSRARSRPSCWGN